MQRTTWTQNENGTHTAELTLKDQVMKLLIEKSGDRFKAFVNETLVATRATLPRAQNSARFFAVHPEQIKGVTPKTNPKASGGNKPAPKDENEQIGSETPAEPAAPVASGPVKSVTIGGVATDVVVWHMFEDIQTKSEKRGAATLTTITAPASRLEDLAVHLEDRLKTWVTAEEFGSKAGDMRKAVKNAIDKIRAEPTTE